MILCFNLTIKFFLFSIEISSFVIAKQCVKKGIFTTCWFWYYEWAEVDCFVWEDCNYSTYWKIFCFINFYNTFLFKFFFHSPLLISFFFLLILGQLIKNNLFLYSFYELPEKYSFFLSFLSDISKLSFKLEIQFYIICHYIYFIWKILNFYINIGIEKIY